MATSRPTRLVPVCLVVGALLGLGGSFAPTQSLRALAWGIDGIALVVAAALLAVHFLRHGQDTVAAGFLVFLAGQTLVVSGSALSLEASAASFAAGAGLWAAALMLISTPRVMPIAVRALGIVAALLLTATALMIFSGRDITPLSQPLPFFAYPFLVFTLLGWAWWCVRAEGS
jgi:hypothetical protein